MTDLKDTPVIHCQVINRSNIIYTHLASSRLILIQQLLKKLQTFLNAIKLSPIINKSRLKPRASLAANSNRLCILSAAQPEPRKKSSPTPISVGARSE